jgi:hypothetical protein
MPAKGQPTVRHDWVKIRAAYVEGCDVNGTFKHEPAIREIAGIFGVNEVTVRRISAKEGWLQQRSLYVTKVEQARREQRADNMASKAAEFDGKVLETAEALLSLSRRELNRLLTAAKADGKAATSLTMLKDISAIAEKAQRIGRLAMGESTDESGIRAPSGQFFVTGGNIVTDAYFTPS